MNKKRFKIQNGKIRATYGHSLRSKIHRAPEIPPKTLYPVRNAENAKDTVSCAVFPRAVPCQGTIPRGLCPDYRTSSELHKNVSV